MYIDYNISLLFRGDLIESVCILKFMAMPGRSRNHSKFYGYFGFISCKLTYVFSKFSANCWSYIEWFFRFAGNLCCLE